MRERIAAVASLGEPVRRALYEHVVARAEPTSRDDAAEAVGVSRALAAFHLDKLVAAGLLAATYRRLGARTGPGAGRPAKLYARAGGEIAVSLPPRRYELAARLFAGALEATRSRVASESLATAAREFGERLGAEARRRAGPRPSRATLLERAAAVLDEAGFAPVPDDGGLRLRNCPFDALVHEHRDLVCGMNLSLLDGVVAGLRARGIAARLEPRPGSCCVSLVRP